MPYSHTVVLSPWTRDVVFGEDDEWWLSAEPLRQARGAVAIIPRRQCDRFAEAVR